MILILVPVILATINSIKLMRYQLKNQSYPQREIVALVHRIFPEPVPYIDSNRMIASYPSAGFWMSTWGLEDYRKRGVPVMRSLIETNQPRFLIADPPVLRIDDEKCFGQNKSIYRLLDKDYNILKANFIHHWGALYVPGKSFDRLSKGKKQTFEILIEGEYTVEAEGDLSIDGSRVIPGEVIFLSKGQHRIETMKVQSVVLRWGAHLYRPQKPSSEKPIYPGL